MQDNLQMNHNIANAPNNQRPEENNDLVPVGNGMGQLNENS